MAHTTRTLRCFACKQMQVPIKSENGRLNCRECEALLLDPESGYNMIPECNLKTPTKMVGVNTAGATTGRFTSVTPRGTLPGLYFTCVEDARLWMQQRMKMVGAQSATSAASKAHKAGVLYGMEEGMKALDALKELYQK